MFQTIISVLTLSIITFRVSSFPVQEQNAFLGAVLGQRRPLTPRRLILDPVASSVDAAPTSSHANTGDVQRWPLLMQTSMAMQKSTAQVELQAFSFWPLIVISITLCACVVLVTTIVVATSRTDDAGCTMISPKSVIKASDGKLLKPTVQVPESNNHIGALSASMDLNSLIAEVAPRNARVNFMASLVVPPENRLYIAMPNDMLDVRQETMFKVTSAHPDHTQGGSPIAQVVVSEQKCLYHTGPAISLQTLEGGNLGLLSTEGLYDGNWSSVLKLITTFGNEFGSLHNLPVSNTYVLMHRGKTAYSTIGDISKGCLTIKDSDGCLAASVSADVRNMLSVEVEPEIDFGLIVLIVLGVIKIERHKSANVGSVV